MFDILRMIRSGQSALGYRQTFAITRKACPKMVKNNGILVTL